MRGHRLLVPFRSNPCSQVDLAVGTEAGGLVVELDDRPGERDDVDRVWVAVVELRDERAPDAAITVTVDDRRARPIEHTVTPGQQPRAAE